MKDRQELRSGAFLQAEFEFKGLTVKPITARTLLLLEKMKSPFYFGGEQLKGLIDVIYVCSRPASDVLRQINNNTIEEAIYDFADTFSAEDLNALNEIVTNTNNEVAATVVELVEGNSDEKK